MATEKKRLKGRWITILWTIALVFIVLAVLFQLIGLVTPCWVFTSARGTHPQGIQGYDLQTGLWYRVKCEKDDCRRIEFGEENLNDPPNLGANRALAMLAFLVCIFALVATGLNKYFWNSSKMRVMTLVAAIIFCLLSFIFGIVPTARKIQELQDFGELLDEQFRDLSYRVTLLFPYSLFLFGFGTFFIVIAAVPLLINFIFHRKSSLDGMDDVSEGGSMMNYSNSSYPTGTESAPATRSNLPVSYSSKPQTKAEKSEKTAHRSERPYVVDTPDPPSSHGYHKGYDKDYDRSYGRSHTRDYDRGHSRGHHRDYDRDRDRSYEDEETNVDHPDDYEYPEKSADMESYAKLSQPKQLAQPKSVRSVSNKFYESNY